MTLSDFRTRYPEFCTQSEALVKAALTDAAARVSSDAFGARYDHAHGLMAAHLLWTGPAGSTMRLDGGDKEPSSRYLDEFRRVRKESVLAIVVT